MLMHCMKKIGVHVPGETINNEIFKYRGKCYKKLLKVNFNEFLADVVAAKDFCLNTIHPADDEGTEYLCLFLVTGQLVQRRNNEAKRRLLNFTFGKTQIQHVLGTGRKKFAHSYESGSELTMKLYNLLRDIHAGEILKQEDFNYVQHSDLNPELRQYQVKAVRWLLHQEISKVVLPHDFIRIRNRNKDGQKYFYLHPITMDILDSQPIDVIFPTGGILADEMGLGKTVEILALILLNKRKDFDRFQTHADDYEPFRKRIKTSSILHCVCVNRNNKSTILCSKCNRKQHRKCVRKFSTETDSNKNYMCPQCWENMPLVESGATIIVSPQPIKMQWYTEIEKHIASQIKVFVYDGISTKGWISPEELASYEIVLTDYNVLKKEIYFSQSNEGTCSLRHCKKYMRMTSPLLKVKWWRVCLDEAQMVESSNTQAAKMVQILPTYHRWAITGTPIQKSLDDLRGILEFLDAFPYYDRDIFSGLLSAFQDGETSPLINVLSKLMWRTCKIHVEQELGIPPQTEEVHYVKLSDAEKLYYREEHKARANAFDQNLTKLNASKLFLYELDPRTLKLILEPLKKLRQDCTVPVLLQKSEQTIVKKFLQPKELLDHLKSTNEIECKTLLRSIVSNLNGLAGIDFIDFNYNSAIAYYKSVLRRAKDYTGPISVDTLLQIHALHNMVEAYTLMSNATEDNSSISQEYVAECNKLEWKYIENCKDNLSRVSNALEAVRKSLNDAENKLTNSDYGFWWRNILSFLQNAGHEKQLILKINDERQLCGVTLQNNFKSIKGIDLELTIWLDKLQTARSNVLKKFQYLKKYVDIVRPKAELNPEEQKQLNILIKNTFDCHLYAEKNAGAKSVRDSRIKKNEQKILCHLCETVILLRNYECLIFDKVFDEKNENNEGSWNPTFQETILKIIWSLAKTKHISTEDISMGETFFQLIDYMKKEYKELGKFWIEIEYTIKAYDELNMCRQRLQEANLEYYKSSPEIYELVKEDIEISRQHMQFKLEEYEVEFHRKLARLKYIEHLGKDYKLESCPICKQKSETSYIVLVCGHHVCTLCFDHLKKIHRLVISCAICRNTQMRDSVYQITMNSNGENSENDVQVIGDYSNKIVEIVRTILNLRAKDQMVKILIFSHWEPILGVIGTALQDNQIKYRAKSNFKAINEFQSQKLGVTCLLMPLAHGAKGMNLIEATHVFLVEPILNPGEEMQAIGRVHRIGQTKSTTVHRFVVKDTIEETIFNTVRNDKTGVWEKKCITVGCLRDLFVTENHSEMND